MPRLPKTEIDEAFRGRVSSRQAAAELGVCWQTVQNWRNGRNLIKPQFAKILHKKYGLPLHILRPDIWEPRGSKKAA